MTPEWREKLHESQSVMHYSYKGQRYRRIPYGDENPRWGEIPCRCGATKGQLHVVAECGYEACPACGASQLGTCVHSFEEFGDSGGGPVAPSALSRVGDRAVVAILTVVIALCVVATILAAFRVI